MALLAVADALALVLAGAEPLPSEDASLGDAFGRVVTADIAARRTQPPADLSAMDGYAVRGTDVATAPARLTLIGEAAAGHPFPRALGPGEAARIFTGGVVPAGADTVVIQEHTLRDGDGVIVNRATATARNIRRAGLDFTQGQVLIRAGHRLSARDLALAAAMNHATLPVHRRSTVAMLATGDELVPPGSKPGPGQITYSNGYAIMALARAEGALVLDLGIARDTIESTVAAVKRARASGVDILVTSGGASVGDHDVVQRALAAEGMDLSFWRIAMRPGRPMLHGRLGDMHVLGLPGNPVSAFVCSVLFLAPLIRRLGGRTDTGHAVEHAILAHDLPANDERADYLRAVLSPGPAGMPLVRVFPVQDSSMLAPLAEANCLLLRAPHAPPAKAGDPCETMRL